MTGGRRRVIILLLGLVAMTAAVAVYALFDPVSSPLFPKCMFRTITGLDCPGCGSQRAVHAILTGDFRAAWHYNALFILEIPLILLLVITSLFPSRFPRLTRVVYSPIFIRLLLAVIILFTILRNII